MVWERGVHHWILPHTLPHTPTRTTDRLGVYGVGMSHLLVLNEESQLHYYYRYSIIPYSFVSKRRRREIVGKYLYEETMGTAEKLWIFPRNQSNCRPRLKIQKVGYSHSTTLTFVLNRIKKSVVKTFG